MTEAWPIILPQNFENSGYSETVADGLLEMQPDAGPPITRRRSTASPRNINGSMIFTEDQIRTFKTFFDTTLIGGSLPFTFPAQISPAIDMLVKFPKNSLPRWSPLGGGYWRISLTFMVLP